MYFRIEAHATTAPGRQIVYPNPERCLSMISVVSAIAILLACISIGGDPLACTVGISRTDSDGENTGLRMAAFFCFLGAGTGFGYTGRDRHAAPKRLTRNNADATRA